MHGTKWVLLHPAHLQTAQCLSQGSLTCSCNAHQIRVPAWTESTGVRMLLDGEPISCTVDHRGPSVNEGYCSLIRSFRTGWPFSPHCVSSRPPALPPSPLSPCLAFHPYSYTGRTALVQTHLRPPTCSANNFLRLNVFIHLRISSWAGDHVLECLSVHPTTKVGNKSLPCCSAGQRLVIHLPMPARVEALQVWRLARVMMSVAPWAGYATSTVHLAFSSPTSQITEFARLQN